MVRSKLDYGCFVYNSASKTDLEALEIVHRHGLRLCLGAFKSSPIESLYVEANEPPLSRRREGLSMRYGLKIQSNEDNATHESILKSSTVEDSLGYDLSKLFDEAAIDRSKVMARKIPNCPIHESNSIEVNFKLSLYDKSTTNPELFKSKFRELLPDYNEYRHIYTDGSKRDEKAAYGVYCLEFGSTHHQRIADHSSIFTAEMEAIRNSFQYIKKSSRFHKKFVIFSDSKSVLESIENQDSKNPIMINILDTIQSFLSGGIDIKFCWVPSHVGIYGNEKADEAAQEARDGNRPDSQKLPYQDFVPIVKSFVKDKWQESWHSNINNKLYQIMPIIKPFYLSGLSRKNEVIIHRLRIGHTRLTHSYLMEPGRQPAPLCWFCNKDDEIISVKHIMIECTNFRYTRRKHYVAADMKYLFERIPLKNIIGFLKEARLYYEI